MKYMHIVFSLIIWLFTLCQREGGKTPHPETKLPLAFLFHWQCVTGLEKSRVASDQVPPTGKGRRALWTKELGKKKKERRDKQVGRWQLDAAWVWSLQYTFGGVPSHLSIPPILHLVDSTWNKLKVFISFLESKLKFTSYLGIEATTWGQSLI